mmetsp:Transcript_22919/g.65553  ORF Transcript_22919/g.65553 Transcript_22919/m.65553 type:complete len:93 (-) Transcript_22919:2141-2419(-)
MRWTLFRSVGHQINESDEKISSALGVCRGSHRIDYTKEDGTSAQEVPVEKQWEADRPALQSLGIFPEGMRTPYSGSAWPLRLPSTTSSRASP